MKKIIEAWEKWLGEQTIPENIDFINKVIPDKKDMDRRFIAMGFYAGYKSKEKQ